MKLLAAALLVVALSGPGHSELGLTPRQFQKFADKPTPPKNIGELKRRTRNIA